MATPRTSAPTHLHHSTRRIEVFGDISPALVRRVEPRILAYRRASPEPIHLFINSLGGYPDCGDYLWDLLTNPHLMPHVPIIIGICQSKAASTAADLLCRCHHSIAYQRSRLHFHGTRNGALEVTQEVASMLETGLRHTNDSWAQRIVPHVFRRLLLRYARLRAARAEGTAPGHRSGLQIQVHAFGDALSKKVSGSTRDLLGSVIQRSGSWEALARITERNRRNTLPPILMDSLRRRPQKMREELRLQIAALHVLVAGHIATDRRWQITPDTLDTLVDELGDLTERVDYGIRNEIVDVMIQHKETFFGERALGFFLTKRWEEIESTPRLLKRFERAVDKAYKRILPMWSLVLLLCRELQRGEYRFNPRDAWWLGLIDEVHGTRLRQPLPKPVS